MREWGSVFIFSVVNRQSFSETSFSSGDGFIRLTIRVTFAALFMHIRSAIHTCESAAKEPWELLRVFGVCMKSAGVV